MNLPPVGGQTAGLHVQVTAGSGQPGSMGN